MNSGSHCGPSGIVASLDRRTALQMQDAARTVDCPFLPRTRHRHCYCTGKATSNAERKAPDATDASHGLGRTVRNVRVCLKAPEYQLQSELWSLETGPVILVFCSESPAVSDCRQQKGAPKGRGFVVLWASAFCQFDFGVVIRTVWCGQEDSNFHGLSPTTTSTLRVYQFRHGRTRLDR
jgi:hypothetical protein